MIQSGNLRGARDYFLFNNYFTSALLLLCNWPITGIRSVLLAIED